MVQLNNLLSSDSSTAPGQIANAASDKSRDRSHDTFRDVLSQAAGAKSEAASAGESPTPASSDKYTRAAPPPPTTSSASAGSAGSTSSGAAESDSDPFLQLVNSSSAANEAASSSASAASSATATASTALTAQEAFDQAYWAAQPPAVQVLQNAPADQRVQMATQLAQEGYSIDVPIMVWGWDPYTTTNTREADGYTWVPSALQSSVSVAPGITFDGTSYNASDPPSGSIAV